MVLIIGSAVGNLPLMFSLNKQGIAYELVGHSAEQMGALMSPKFTEIHYREEQAFYDFLDEKFLEFPELRLIPGTHDLCLKVYVSYLVLRGRLQTKQYELFEDIHNKKKFRKRLRAISSAHCPNFTDFDFKIEQEFLNFPILFKPEHAGGGRGIKLVQSPSALSDLSSSGQVTNGILEEYVEGDLYSVSIWVKSGILVSYYAEREFIDPGKFKVDMSVSSNSILRDFCANNIPYILAEILLEFGFHSGFAHVQLILTQSGRWIIVEAMLRLPGDMFSYRIEQFGNLNYSKFYLESFPFSGSSFTEMPPCARFQDNLFYVRLIGEYYKSFFEDHTKFSSYYSHTMKCIDRYEISFLRCNALPEAIRY